MASLQFKCKLTVCRDMDVYLDDSEIESHISAKHLDYFPLKCAWCEEGKEGQKHFSATKEDMKKHTSKYHNGKNARYSVFEDDAKEDELKKLAKECRCSAIPQIRSNDSKIALRQVLSVLGGSTSIANNAENGLQVKQENYDDVIVIEDDNETAAMPNASDGNVLEQLPEEIPSATSTEPRVKVEIGQIAVDPISNLEDDITSNAVILTKLESDENISNVPIGRRCLDLQAALSSFVPIDIESNEDQTNSVTTKTFRKQRISRKKRSHLGDSSSNSVGKKKRMSLPQQSAEHVPDVSPHPDLCSTANAYNTIQYNIMQENAYNSDGEQNDERRTVTKENVEKDGKSSSEEESDEEEADDEPKTAQDVAEMKDKYKMSDADFRKLVAGKQQMVRKTVQEEVGHLQPSTSRNTATYQQSTSKLSKPAKKDARKESHKKGQDFDGTHDKFLHALKYARTFMEFGNDPYEIMVMTKDGAGEGIVGQKTFNPKVKDLIWALSNYKHIQDEISHKLLGLTLAEDFYDWWVHPENGWKQMADDIQEAWRDRCTQRQADQKERNDRAKKNTSGVTKKSTPRVWGSAANKKINTACGNWTANEKNRGKPGYEPKFPSFDWNHAPDDVALSQITFRLVDPTKKGPDGKKADLNYDALRSLIYKTYKEEVGKKDDSSERKEFLQPYLGNKHDKNKGLLKLQEKRTGSANAQTSKNDPKKTATVSSRKVHGTQKPR